MLKEKMKGTLPYPPGSVDLIIYNFLVKENNGQKLDGWIYDLGTEQFKYPMSRLNQSPLFWYGTKINGEVNEIEGTNICWKIESEMFVFWIVE